jgi:hypothetical protein
MPKARLLPSLLVSLALVAPAYAGDDEEITIEPDEVAEPERRDGAATARKEGDYAGVVPGRGLERSRASRARGGAPTVRWIGFQVKDGAPRVFVQLDAEPTIEQRVEGAELIVTIAGARLGARNHKRPLDTRFFDTAVESIFARRAPAARGRRGAAVEIRVRLKDAGRTAAARTERGQDGFHYLYLDF